VLRAVAFAGLVLVGVLAQSARWQEVFFSGGVYFLDPDCYSRMTRVAELEAGGGPAIRFHDFENAPIGVVPHTTAPMDFLILGFARALEAGGIAQARDVAGALVSPLLGAFFLFGIAVWAWPHAHGMAALALAALSPALAHAFSIGRPDHQSLALILVVLAWIAESRLPHRGWVWVASITWALALWVSLFEPLVLMALALTLRFVRDGRGAMPADRTGWAAAAAFFCVCAGWMIFEGWRFAVPDAGERALFQRWARTIGELRGAGLPMLFGWVGWLAVFFPVSILAWQKRDRGALCGAIATGILLAGSLWTARWGYFWVAGTVLIAPSAMGILRPHWLASTAFVVSMWPVAAAWDRQLFPEGEALALREERRAENLLLRDVAEALHPLPEGTVMAPWWLSPALAYWSGRPCVAGSSHQSLPGIADSARFYLAEDSPTAEKIVRHRQVIAVLADDPSRIIENSSSVLSLPASDFSVAAQLMGGSDLPFLEPVRQNRFFRLYRVRVPK
jgi:hypothetical protein